MSWSSWFRSSPSAASPPPPGAGASPLVSDSPSSPPSPALSSDFDDLPKVRKLTDFSHYNEEFVKEARDRMESPDNTATLGHALESATEPFRQVYDEEDTIILQIWATRAAARGFAGAGFMAGTCLGLVNYMNWEFVRGRRKAILVGAVSLWGGILGALSTSPEWIRRIAQIDRPESLLRKQVLQTVMRHNPRYFELAREQQKNAAAGTNKPTE